MRIGLIGVGRIGAFHAQTLCGLPAVDSVVVTDADIARASDVSGRLGAEAAASVDALFKAGIDAVVIATGTATHPELIRRGVDAGLPVFCEKPLAPDLDGTLDVVKWTNGSAAPVQAGFQRRFDAGFLAARDAAQSGALGWLHTIRSTTFDAAPPPAGYVPGSGGLFRDCAVHDFDAIRWVSGHEVAQAYAVGANRGEDFFRSAGDVDTASVVLTLDDGTIAVVSCGRYNAGGYDVRFEVLGSMQSICAGLDDRLPLRPAVSGERFPAGPPYQHFMERFRDAYAAELLAFTELVSGRSASQCTPQDALEAFYIAEACELSRRRNAPVEISQVRR